MANNLAAVTPRLLAQGLNALREVAIMPQLVNRAYETQAGQKGTTIDVPIPSAIAAQDVVPAPTPPTDADIGPTSVPIPLDKWKEAPFYLTDNDVLQIMDGVIPMQASEAIKSLANLVNQDILALYKKFYGFAGTAGTTPFGDGTTSSATAIRKVLNKNLAPLDDRHVVLDPDAEANALNVRAFQDASWSNSPAAIVDANLNRKIGFQWWMHQLAPTHIPGTATGITTAVLNASGATTVTLKVASGTGTLVEGDLLTFAGMSQQYVVTAGVTLTTGGVATSIQPALTAAVDGSGTPVAVTRQAQHVANLAFHRDAIAFATRPFMPVEPGLGAIVRSAVDPLSGLTLRLEVTREYKRTRYSYDILYGTGVVRRALGARLLG
jgi:hypothetical protein